MPLGGASERTAGSRNHTRSDLASEKGGEKRKVQWEKMEAVGQKGNKSRQ